MAEMKLLGNILPNTSLKSPQNTCHREITLQLKVIMSIPPTNALHINSSPTRLLQFLALN